MREHDALEKNPRISKSALEALHGQLYGWALSRCGFNAEIAEDLMQETYLQLISGRARFDARSSLKTFVFGVVQNLARRRYRRHNTHLRVVDAYQAEQETSVAEDDEKPNLKIVWDAVHSLPQRQRDITELVFIRELSIAEASAVMGVSIGTGRTHYERAKQALAAKLMILQRPETVR